MTRTYAIAPTPTTGLAMNNVEGCSNWRVSRWCPARNLIKNPSMETGLTGWNARTPGGGNQIIPRNDAAYSGLASGYALSTGAAFPGVYYDFGYLISGNQGKTFTLSIAVNPDVKQVLTLNVIAAAGSDRLLATLTRDIVCGWERMEVVFAIPNNSDYGTAVTGLKFEITTLVNSPFYFDAAMLIEGVKKNFLYFDGDERGKWVGTPGNSYSDADENEPNGELVDLKDLGFNMLGYVGLGLPASEHIGNDAALSGGRTYDRTVQRARQFSLTGRIYDYDDDLQSYRARLIEIFKPQNADFRARDVIIEYQPCECEGVMCCRRRIRAKFIEDGLAGNIDSPGGETLTLKFEEAAPPMITEEAGSSKSLVASTTITLPNVIGYTQNTGWINPTPSGLPSSTQILSLAVTDTGTYIAGSFGVGNFGVRLGGSNGTTTTPAGMLANTVVGAVAVAPNGDLWVSGDLNALYYLPASGATAVNVSSGFTRYANKILFHPNGNVYVFDLLMNGSYMAVSADYGATWVVPGATGVNGSIEDATILSDGRIILVGDFTQAGGVACKNAAIYTPNTNSFQALATSTDGRILAVAVGLDGKVYLGGEFGVINGISCIRIAQWNGTQVQAMGAGFSSPLSPAVYTIAINPCNGEVWVGGKFTAAGSIPCSNIAVWNGSTWASPDVEFASAGTYVNTAAFDRSCAYIAGLAGGYNAGATTSGQTSICYNGTADERPIIKFTGPGRIRNLRNLTTGATIYMDYTMQRGEMCTLDLTREAKVIFKSSYYGPKPGAILRGSDLDRFALKASSRSNQCKTCPNNLISVFISNNAGVGGAVLAWENRHWGIDAECGAPVKRRETNTGGTPFSILKTISGVLTTCNGNLSGQPVTVFDDQGNTVNVTTGAGGTFSVTLPFPASDTFVTAVFNQSGAQVWGGVTSYAQLRVFKNDPSTLTFPAFTPTPCCALQLRLFLNTASGAPVNPSGAVTVTVSSSGGGTPISVTKVMDAPGVFLVYQSPPTINPGTLTINVTAPGYGTQTGTATFSLCNRIDLTISTFGVSNTTVQGTLLDCNNNPVSGATVQITHIDGLNAARNLTTNASGFFTDTFAYAPGVLIATVTSAPGYTNVGVAESRYILTTPGQTITFGGFVNRPCPNTVTLSGLITDCYGTELQSRTITISDSVGNVRTATTNLIGAFSISAAWAIGTITATFTDSVNYNTGPAVSTVQYNGTATSLSFPAFSPLPCCPITLQGTVTDTNGAGVPAANVTITDSNLQTYTTITSSTGAWSIVAPILPGPYTATAAASGYTGTQTLTGTFSICSSYTLNFSGVLVPRLSGLLGTIEDCNTNPVAFATVTVTDSLNRVFTGTTNALGIFSMNAAMALGAVTIRVTSAGYSNSPTTATKTLTVYGQTLNLSTTDFSPTLCTAAVGSFGLLSSGLRDKYKWPFSVGSIWNTPIGVNATLVNAGITFGAFTFGYITRFIEEEEIIFMDPTAPNTTVRYSPVGWNGGDRCVASGSNSQFPFTVRMPASALIANDGNNNSTAWIDSAGNTVIQAQPTARCGIGSDATALVRFADENIYGKGENGAHGGSNLSALGGTIRYGEWTYVKNNNLTYFRHALKMNMMAQKWYYWGGGGGNQYRWPATTADGYASGSTYAGTNSQLKPGSLLALPSSFNVAALLTQPGRIIAETLKRFGAYLVDDTAWNACAVALERGPLGNAKDEFQTVWGYSWRQQPDTTPQKHEWYKDWEVIIAALCVVTNSASNAIGGGGSPAYSTPVAPGIGN